MTNAYKKRIFVLGVGAQKAGTTWLHNYLSGLKGANFGFAKEYHFLDYLNLPSSLTDKRHLTFLARKELDFASTNSLPSTGWPEEPALARLAFLQNPCTYYSYFLSLYLRGAWLSGDITPAYSMLDANILRNFDEHFLSLGIIVKAIYVVRSPVHRLISSVRHWRWMHGMKPISGAAEIGFLRSLAPSIPESILERGNYRKTLGVLSNAFPSCRLHIELFERILTIDGVNRLCKFIGTEAHEPNLHVRLNSTGACVDNLPDDLLLDLAESQREQVEACMQFFGEDVIRQCWPLQCSLLSL